MMTFQTYNREILDYIVDSVLRLCISMIEELRFMKRLRKSYKLLSSCLKTWILYTLDLKGKHLESANINSSIN